MTARVGNARRKAAAAAWGFSAAIIVADATESGNSAILKTGASTKGPSYKFPRGTLFWQYHIILPLFFLEGFNESKFKKKK